MGKHFYAMTSSCAFNTLRPRQNGRHFADDTFKRIFIESNVRNSINISLKFVPKGRIHNITSLVRIMAWCRPGDKPLSEHMLVRLPTQICVTGPQWVKAHDTEDSNDLYSNQWLVLLHLHVILFHHVIVNQIDLVQKSLRAEICWRHSEMRFKIAHSISNFVLRCQWYLLLNPQSRICQHCLTKCIHDL